MEIQSNPLDILLPIFCQSTIKLHPNDSLKLDVFCFVSTDHLIWCIEVINSASKHRLMITQVDSHQNIMMDSMSNVRLSKSVIPNKIIIIIDKNVYLRIQNSQSFLVFELLCPENII